MHEAMGHPSDAALIEMLKSPSLINCPTSASDVSNARAIYGPCSVCLEGKPRPVKGSNASLDQFTVTAPGQLLHVDVALLHPEGPAPLLCGRFVRIHEHGPANIKSISRSSKRIINNYQFLSQSPQSG